MAKEIQLFGKKKDVYPSKTTINFYIKEEKSTGVSTILLYTIFAAVVLMALAKMLVFDMTSELNNQKAIYNANYAKLESYKERLSTYDEVMTEYNRYSYSYLTKNDNVQNRMDVLKMLEETIFKKSNVQSIVISDDIVSVSIKEIDLEGTSSLAKQLEGYEMVESVTVNAASFGGTYTSNMVIVLKPESEMAGGTK